MVKFINRMTGTEMWVTDERVEEYKAAGHKLAASNSTSEKKAEKKAKSAKKR